MCYEINFFSYIEVFDSNAQSPVKSQTFHWQPLLYVRHANREVLGVWTRALFSKRTKIPSCALVTCSVPPYLKRNWSFLCCPSIFPMPNCHILMLQNLPQARCFIKLLDLPQNFHKYKKPSSSSHLVQCPVCNTCCESE